MNILKGRSRSLVLGMALFFVSPLHASEITGTDLLNLLVENNILEKDAATAFANDIRSRPGVPPEDAVSSQDVLDLLLDEGVIDQQSYDALQTKMQKRAAAVEDAKDDARDQDKVRVPYIPDYVRQEMHESLKFSVEADVVDKVKEEAVRTARVYGWGIKEAPSWVHKIKLSGDGRIRYQGDFFPSSNGPFAKFDVGEINAAGGIASNSAFDNVVDDRHRLRARFRLMLEAKPFERIKLGMRLVTGNEGDPVSSNQTLGQFNQKWDTNMDLGYIQYDALSADYMLIGGRFKNPFMHTDLVFDSDMAFEGLGGSYYFNRDDTLFGDKSQWDTFLTLGAFPIQEIHQFRAQADGTVRDAVADSNSDDKFLYAVQIGSTYDFFNTNQFSFGLAYYHYDNITGKRNEPGSTVQDVTTSGFYQTGNSLMNISNDPNDPNRQTLALASEFELVNATIKYRMVNFHPTYVWFHADYVQNIAFDKEELIERTGNTNMPDRDRGYQFGVSFGTQKVKYLRDWNVSFKYRHLEGDAVLDAFADSDFLLGGTDAEGYIIQAQYAVLDNTVTSIKWISADSIDADRADELFSIGVDTLQLDLTAKF